MFFDFAHLENFSATDGFSGAENRKNEAVFREFFEMVNLDEIFYVMKVVGKFLVGVFLIKRTVKFTRVSIGFKNRPKPMSDKTVGLLV